MPNELFFARKADTFEAKFRRGCPVSRSCPKLVPALSQALSGTGKPLKRGHLAILFVLVPLIFIKRTGVKFSPLFQAIFHALVKNVTHCISVLTAILVRFSRFFEKVCHTCATGKAFEHDGDESNDNSPSSIVSHQFPRANTKVRETLDFPLLA
jgi:hypothetical protein